MTTLPVSTHAAWDFTLSEAKPYWLYGYYGQAGKNGFFGLYDVDLSSTGGRYAPLNGWVGNQDVGVLVAGTNAAISTLSLSNDVRLGQEWIALKGRYTINAYNTSSTQGSFVAMSPGSLTMWQLWSDLPLFKVTFGKQQFVHACGLQFSQNRTAEFIVFERSTPVPDLLYRLVTAGWLPRGVMSWFNPLGWAKYKRQGYEKPYPYGNENYKEPEDEFFKDPETGKSKFKVRDEAQAEDEFFNPPNGNGESAKKASADEGSYAWGQLGPGLLKMGFGTYPWQRIDPTGPVGAISWNTSDLNAATVQNWLAYLEYSSTDLILGVGFLRSTSHQGPELQPTVAQRISTPTLETYLSEGWLFLKYNNGRLFFNTELDWFNRIFRFQRSLSGFFGPDPEFYTDGSGRSRFAPLYRESWRFAAETGTWCGPVGMRFLYAFLPGPDRRHGILIDRQPFIQDTTQSPMYFFDPYSILFSYRFGAGVNAPAQISDATVLGAKVDYALAANLVVEGSFLQAYRTSHGYGWGYIRPDFANFGQLDYNIRGVFGSSPPAIPNNNLGWEASIGVRWRLLEGWDTAFRFSYWKPGKWFNYACVDRGVPNWDNPSPGNNWGTNPNRDIDPIMGFELSLGGTY
jgi:hypothetical protein